MLDWLGKMVGLPPQFLSQSPGSRGGGVIQASASECVLDCLLAARAQAIRALKVKMGDQVEDTVLLSKLMAYCSKVSGCSVQLVFPPTILSPDLTTKGCAERNVDEEDCMDVIDSILVLS